MNRLSSSLLCILLVLFSVSYAASQTTTFNYQGSLNASGLPANGTFDFEFAVYNALTLGTQLGSTLTRSSVQVTNGVFSVSLDFGNLFGGAGNRYMEIRVKPVLSGSYTTLTPRTQLTATPYSIRTIQADDAATLVGSPPSFFQNASNMNAGILPDSRISNNIPRLGTSNSFAGGIQIDNGDANNGTVGLNTLRFGGGASGEGISSRRTSGTNQWGLDFYTNSQPRMAVDLNGNVGIGTQTPSAKLDVNGNLNALNLPAFKGTQTNRDPRNLNAALVIAAGAFADLNTISVNVPAAGTLLITATANVHNADTGGNTAFTNSWFKLEETTSGSPVMLTEVGNFAYIDTGLNVTQHNGSTMTISWTVPAAAAGTRSFKTAMTMSANVGNYQVYVYTTSLNVLYIGKSL